MNKLFKKIAMLAFGAVMAIGVGVGLVSNTEATAVHAEGETNTLILDAKALNLNSTATPSESTRTYSDIDFVVSAGAKGQNASGTNKFSSNQAILIGKSGAYIYNKTAFPGAITKIEIFANTGASTSVQVGVMLGFSAITSYNSSNSVFEQTLSTVDKIYEVSPSEDFADATFFRYQVLNSKNSQVQIRITYSTTPVVEPEIDSISFDQGSDLTKKQYTIAEKWSTEGLSATVKMKNEGDEYKGTVNYTFDPATPEAMGPTDNGFLTVTAWANDEISISKTFEGIVVTDLPSHSYELITANSQLEIGVKYVLGNGSNVFMSTTQNTNNRGQITISTVENNVVTFKEGLHEIETITLGSDTEGYYTLKANSVSNSNCYLYAGSTTSNYLKTGGNGYGTHEWSIDIAEDGVATIINKDTTRRGTLRWNETSGIFSCYADSSTQKNVYLYKEVVELTATEKFAQSLLDLTGTICGDGNYDDNATQLEGAWDMVTDAWEALEAEDQAVFTSVTASETGSLVEQAAARYDYVVGKYSLEDIASRNPAKVGSTRFFITENTVDYTALIIVATVAILGVSALIIIKRRRSISE